MAVLTASKFVEPAMDRRPGILRRAFDRLVAARMAEAERTIAAHLLPLDDATLATRGFSRADLLRLSGRGR